MSVCPTSHLLLPTHPPPPTHPQTASIGFDEFFTYLSARDKEMRAVFNSLDTEHTGAIALSKVRRALHVLNVHPAGGYSEQAPLLQALMSKSEAQRQLKSGGGSGSAVPAGHITYEEFREF
jgi:hypothetical protein